MAVLDQLDDYFVLLEPIKRPLNEGLNKLRPVATECRKDAQCMMAPTDCSPCREVGAAVNVGYQRFCPLQYKEYEAICSGRERQWQEFRAVCQNGACVAVHPDKTL